jgi:hypothetical protein
MLSQQCAKAIMHIVRAVKLMRQIFDSDVLYTKLQNRTKKTRNPCYAFSFPFCLFLKFTLLFSLCLPPYTLPVPRELIRQLQRRLDIHTQQLLNEQLSRIWQSHSNHTPRALTTLTPILISHHTASLTHINFMCI